MKYTPYQTAELRRLLREACLKRDKVCVKCGSKGPLETSHIYPKGAYKGLQYDLGNVVALCGTSSLLDCHHAFWHAFPIKSMQWFEQTYPQRAAYLKQQSLKLNKPKPYKEVKETLLLCIDKLDVDNYDEV